jgi:hypothetical protein
MELLKRTLLKRLINKGIEGKSITAFIRDVTNSISDNKENDIKRLDGKIKSLGWDNFELDEYTFQLVIANLETKTIGRYHRQDYWQILAL